MHGVLEIHGMHVAETVAIYIWGRDRMHTWAVKPITGGTIMIFGQYIRHENERTTTTQELAWVASVAYSVGTTQQHLWAGQKERD